mmetsp:Transcript_3782/g.8122  ORF Transcript_3782/g.8122 Transcript_3782/m.8122 type:complete len:210 (-) Transcript_3782:327-956(-)
MRQRDLAQIHRHHDRSGPRGDAHDHAAEHHHHHAAAHRARRRRAARNRARRLQQPSHCEGRRDGEERALSAKRVGHRRAEHAAHQPAQAKDGHDQPPHRVGLREDCEEAEVGAHGGGGRVHVGVVPAELDRAEHGHKGGPHKRRRDPLLHDHDLVLRSLAVIDEDGAELVERKRNGVVVRHSRAQTRVGQRSQVVQWRWLQLAKNSVSL